MLNLIETRGFSNPKNARNFALLNVAMYDATVAAWDAKYTFNRARPGVADPGVQSTIAAPRSPSYPSEHAATAGAAAEILAYLYPADAQSFRYLAEEAARAALTAGSNYPSDVSAGLELGRAVGAKVVAMAQNDGSQAVWTGSVPSGAGLWVGTAPLEPLAGTWKTWVLSSGNQLRPGPPVASDSPQKRAELDEIRNYPRTFASNAKGFYYQSPEGVFRVFYDELSKRILEQKLDENPPAAARAYALAAIAHNDGSVACWDAKYTYWAARPNQLDASIVTLFPQPGHPSYPSAHGCFSGAIARVIGQLFPTSAARWRKDPVRPWSPDSGREFTSAATSRPGWPEAAKMIWRWNEPQATARRISLGRSPLRLRINGGPLPFLNSASPRRHRWAPKLRFAKRRYAGS